MKRVLPLFLIFIIMSLFFATPVFADIELCPVCGEYHADFFKEEAGRIAYSMNKVVYGNDSGFFSDLLGDIAKLDVENAGSGFNMASLWNIIENIYGSLAVVGILLVVVHFGMELMDIMQADQLNPEKMVMMFFKLALSILVINNGFEIMTFFAGLANVIYDKLSIGVAGMNTELYADLCNYSKVAKGSVWDGIGEILLLAGPWLVKQVVNVLIMVICYVRIIEIGAVAMFAPIGMSDIGFKGYQGSGWKYLKRLFALFLQGAVIMAIQMAHGTLSVAMNTSILVGCIYDVVLVLVIFKSQTMANEIAGVN